MKVLPVLFEQHEIRRLYDKKTETRHCATPNARLIPERAHD
jgi:hypothetical protein